MKRIIFLLSALLVTSVFYNTCFASEAKIEQAIYNDDVHKLTLNITGLHEVAGKEAAVAMYDTKNPALPVYFAQTDIDENDEVNYKYVFRMPDGRSCEEYSICVNAYNAVKLTTTPQSIYDKK